MMRKLFIPLGIVVLAVHASSAVAQSQFDLSGTIQPSTCEWALGDDDKTVAFDPIDASVLNAEGSGGFKTFNLTLQNCSLGLSSVLFTFTGTPDPNDPLRQVNHGTAQGTAVELEWAADNSTIGANNTNNSRSITLVGNSATVNLRAGYWRTAQVTPGTVNAVVTVAAQYF
jgi:type 1 fimbria pilin